MEELKSFIDQIKKSPLFNFSLGSKELFHSDFINWLCNKYKREMGQIFSEFINNLDGIVEIKQSTRESKNIDITIEFENGQYLAIENKIKSIPNNKQLEEYSGRNNENYSYLLLTLIDPDFNNKNWNVMNYDTFYHLLIKQKIEVKDDYDEFLIFDYLKFLRFLIDLKKYLKINYASDLFDFYSDVYKDLKKIRMQDLYLKIKYGLLALKIKNLNKHKFKEVLVNDNNTNVDYETLLINAGISNGKGILFIYIYLNETTKTIIFLDKINFGLGFSGGNSLDVEKIALKYENVWFDFGLINNYVIQKKWKSKNIFNKFEKGKFLYKSVKLRNDFKLDDLVQIISEYISKALDLNKTI